VLQAHAVQTLARGAEARCPAGTSRNLMVGPQPGPEARPTLPFRSAIPTSGNHGFAEPGVGMEVAASLECAVPVARSFDFPDGECHKIAVKVVKTTAGKRTPGTVAVAKHRRLMNRLTATERRRLHHRAAELLS